MYRARPLRVLLCLLAAFLAAGAVRAQTADPATLQAAITGARLEPARAVALKNVKLGVGLGMLRLDDGVLIPATPVGGKTIEMVFLGKGRIEVDPPDAVEAGQLDLFTGTSRLDVEFKDAVLVVGLDAAVSALLRKPAAQADAETVRRGEELYASWKGRKERKLLNVERGILLDALNDPAGVGYFAALFRGSELGDFLYAVEPDSQEQVSLGHFVPLDATEKEKRKIAREIAREQRQGRLLGVAVDDLGQWDTWLSAPLRNAQGKPAPGAPTFEPKKYTLDVRLGDGSERLTGRARIDLEPVVAGSRAVLLRLPTDFQVQKVTDAKGADLFYHRTEEEITVILPAPPAAGETATVNVEYGGSAVEKDWNLYTLRDTLGWYPHAGAVDRAAFDVTFRWPKGLELVASGRRMDGGESPDGSRWERRVLDVPSLGFSFEVGHFKAETARAGHVELTFAFGSGTAFMSRDLREVVKKAVADSLQFYEETFGPYPLDHLVVTTANRGFSQGMLGFLTLSNTILDSGVGGWYFVHPDTRLVVAHEVAHQWWGNQVGWTGYRDQWISEAMASYSARLFGKERLNNVIGMDLTKGWQKELSTTLKDGRSLESVGPVVLGTRLFSSHSEGAYEAIVYNKGAIVLDMLAHLLGEDSFPKVLKQIIKVENGRTISTEDLFSLIERITSSDLKPFTDRFVYGTGLPEILYSYRFEKKGDGWVVRGEARQQTPHRYHYKVVQTPRGTFDVTRAAIQQIDVRQSALVVPVDIEAYDPKQPKGKGKDGANSTIKGNILVRGESTPFEIPVEHEPKALWLDRHAQVFGLFFDENRHPKRMLLFRGQKAAVEGKAGEAVALFDKALETEEPPPDNGETVYYAAIQYARRLMNAQIELGRARLLLDQGKDDEAEAALGRVDRLFRDDDEYRLLQARLDLRRGNYDRAFQGLRKGLKSNELDSEGYAVLAVAARATGHKEELDKALKKARENGADVTLLSGS
jgi:hypothetical protein